MLLVGLAAAYLAALVDLTLVRFPQPAPEPNLVPMRTIVACWESGGRMMAVNVVGNLALLAPVGVLLPMMRPRRTGAVGVAAAGMLLSGVIEASQFACGHRMADVDDVVLNTAGAVLGYAAVVALGWLVAAEIGWGSVVGGAAGAGRAAARSHPATRPAR